MGVGALGRQEGFRRAGGVALTLCVCVFGVECGVCVERPQRLDILDIQPSRHPP